MDLVLAEQEVKKSAERSRTDIVVDTDEGQLDLAISQRNKIFKDKTTSKYSGGSKTSQAMSL